MKTLSQNEKQEMLKDARSPKRRAAFAAAQVAADEPSFDSYLKFLNSVHKVFSEVSASSVIPYRKNFKL